MGKVTGFMETGRLTPQRRDKNPRIADWLEVYLKWDQHAAKTAPKGYQNGCEMGRRLQNGPWRRNKSRGSKTEVGCESIIC